MENELLRIENLTVQFMKDRKPVHAVNNLSLTLGYGETLGLVGETGAGKTTTAKSILKIVPQPPGEYVSGRVLVEGRNVFEMSQKELRKMRGYDVSMIFQDPMTSLNPVLTVGEQIAEVVRLHEKVSRAEASKKAKEMLEMVGIDASRYSDYPHQFSGGMKQRVVIAIALACNPKLLIADEPTTALDVTIQAQVLDIMRELKNKLNTSMLLITHDLGVVAEVCDRVAVIYAGEVIEEGTLEQIYEDPRHPYTKGLFGSIPNLEDDSEIRLKPIAGLMPDPMNLPSGCAFHPRCSECSEQCKTAKPCRIEVAEGHFVKCLHIAKEVEDADHV